MERARGRQGVTEGVRRARRGRREGGKSLAVFCCLLNPFRGRPRLLMEQRVGTAATPASGPASEQQHFLGLHPQAPPPSAQNACIMRKDSVDSTEKNRPSVTSAKFCCRSTNTPVMSQTVLAQISPSVMSQRAPGVSEHTPRLPRGQAFGSTPLRPSILKVR